MATATAVGWTARAEDSFGRALTLGRGRVMSVVRSAARKRLAPGVAWHSGKKAVQGLPENVYELRYTHSHRVLVREAGDALVIVDLGDHDVTKRYAALPSPVRQQEFDAWVPAPSFFDHPSPLFEEIEWAEGFDVAGDSRSGWAEFLTPEQGDHMIRLFAEAGDAVDRREPFVGYLRGGAGTGKTAILLNVATHLAEAGYSVDFRCSSALSKYLRAHTGIKMSLLRARSGPRVIILDDPPSSQNVRDVMEEARGEAGVSVLVGFDPMQWTVKKVGLRLSRLPAADLDLELTVCFRQASELARNAVEFIAKVHERSSFRQDPNLIDAERRTLAELSGRYLAGMSFARPGGRMRVIDYSMAELARESDRITTRTDLWTDLPALLALEDRSGGFAMPRSARSLRRGVKTVTAALNEIEKYRGLDFQVAWIFMTRSFYERVENGATGLRGDEWTRLLNLHISLTRARDETVIFIV